MLDQKNGTSLGFHIGTTHILTKNADTNQLQTTQKCDSKKQGGITWHINTIKNDPKNSHQTDEERSRCDDDADIAPDSQRSR